MTDPKHSPPTPPKRSVLDPDWEEALRRGQEGDEERRAKPASSVDAELAIVHLLRHAREPEPLAAEDLDAIWTQIELEVAPAGVPWWRKAWVWWSAPALAAAAALVVVFVSPGRDEATVAVHDAGDRSAEKSDDERAESPAPAAVPEGAAAEFEEEAEDREAAEPTAVGQGAPGSRGAGASPFELSFAKLAPHGRETVRVAVDHSRAELRSQLLATARGGG
jgi:hypothetical protein